MTAVDGVIHDIGYQRYTGPRLGRAASVAELYRHGLRACFGLGRSGKAKVFPFIVIGLVMIVAVVAVALRSQSDQVVITYRGFVSAVAIPMLLFVAVAAPELVCRDLRDKALPLYFSRPLRRTDYAAAKLAAMVSAFWLVLAAPLLLMFLGGVFSQKHGALGAWQEFVGFLLGLSYALIEAGIFGALGVLLASLASRRPVAAGLIVAVFLITAPVVGVIEGVGGDTADKVAPVLNPVSLVHGLEGVIYGSPPGAGVGGYGWLYLLVGAILFGGCSALLLVRYQKVAA